MWLKDPAFQMDRQLSKHFLLNNPLFSLSFWKTACNIYQIATVHIYHLSLNFLFHPTNWKNQMLSDWFKVYSSIQRMDCQWQILPSPFNSCYYFCPFLSHYGLMGSSLCPVDLKKKHLGLRFIDDIVWYAGTLHNYNTTSSVFGKPRRTTEKGMLPKDRTLSRHTGVHFYQ